MPLFARRYERKRQLGSGEFSDVWLAHDQNLKTEVALKVLKNGAPIDDAIYEGSTLMALRGEHILPILDANIYQDIAYIVTHVVAGGTAERRARPRGVDSSTAIAWTRDLLVGLDVCHSHGLLYRDVRLNNLFLQNDDKALLGDMGLAHMMDANQEAPAAGHWAIRAPEAYAEGKVSIRSEVYSAALALLHLLIGRNPLHRATEAETMAAAAAGDYGRVRDHAPHVPYELSRPIEKALAIDPNERFGSVMEFHAALGGIREMRIDWCEVEPHEGHTRCWLGTSRTAKQDLSTCVIRAQNAFSIEVRKTTEGRRVIDLCHSAVKQRDLPVRLRGVFDHAADA